SYALDIIALLHFPTRRSSDLDGYHSAGRLLSHTVCEYHCGISYILLQLPGRWLIRRSTAVSNAVPCRRNDCRWGKEPPRYFYAGDRKSTRLNSSHVSISYAVF